MRLQAKDINAILTRPMEEILAAITDGPDAEGEAPVAGRFDRTEEGYCSRNRRAESSGLNLDVGEVG